MGASSSGARLVVCEAQPVAEAWPVSAPRPRRAPGDRAVRLAAREAALERAVRAHPAGSALRTRAGGVPPVSGMPAGGGAGAVRPAAQPPRPRLRLTGRGKLVLAVLVLALAVGLATLGGGLLGGGAGGLHLTGESSVVVHRGDTLWSIARSVAGDDDVRVVVAKIRQVNGLPGTTLQPGQVLRLP